MDFLIKKKQDQHIKHKLCRGPAQFAVSFGVQTTLSQQISIEWMEGVQVVAVKAFNFIYK